MATELMLKDTRVKEYMISVLNSPSVQATSWRTVCERRGA